MDFNSRIVLVQIEIVHILLAVITKANSANELLCVCVCLGRKSTVSHSSFCRMMMMIKWLFESHTHNHNFSFVRLLAGFDWDSAVKLFQIDRGFWLFRTKRAIFYHSKPVKVMKRATVCITAFFRFEMQLRISGWQVCDQHHAVITDQLFQV